MYGLQTAHGQDANDPLGGALYGRAVQQEQGFKQGQYAYDMAQPSTSANMQLSMAHSREPMSTYQHPEWSKFYQAVNEAAPGGIKPPVGRGDPMSGVPNAPFAAPSTMWQSGQSSAVSGRPYNPQQAAVQGLQGARR